MRNSFLSASLIATALLATFSMSPALAQNKDGEHPPVIDIHVHTFGGIAGVGPIYPFNPQFLASDLQSKQSPFGWSKQDCTNLLEPCKITRGIQEGRAGRI